MEYRLESKVGDIVLIKNSTLAIVTNLDILCGGHVKEITLHPLTGPFHSLFLFLTGQLRPAEEQINKLTKVGSIRFIDSPLE